MSKKGNFSHNHPMVVSWLNKHNIDFWQSPDGQHMKILGATSAIELWPSKMTYHVLMTEHIDPNKYFRNVFNWYLDNSGLQQLDRLLNE